MATDKTKGDLTKERFINKAILLFSKHGYDGVSLEEIASELNVSKTAPIYHFKSKFGLFSAIVRYIQDKRIQVYRDEEEIRENGYERLLRFATQYVTWVVLTNSEAQVYLLLFYFSSVNREFNDLYEEIALQERKIIENYLLMAEREGLLAGGIDSKVIARRLHNFLRGYLVDILNERRERIKMQDLSAELNEVLSKNCGILIKANA